MKVAGKDISENPTAKHYMYFFSKGYSYSGIFLTCFLSLSPLLHCIPLFLLPHTASLMNLPPLYSPSAISIPHPHLYFILTSQGTGMANKGPSYGMSRQVQDKIDSKYDPELEMILVEWINRQCGASVGKPEAGKMGFQAWLKDGCVSAQSLFRCNYMSPMCDWIHLWVCSNC